MRKITEILKNMISNFKLDTFIIWGAIALAAIICLIGLFLRPAAQTSQQSACRRLELRPIVIMYGKEPQVIWMLLPTSDN